MAVTIATAANYWISPNALSITLNALGEANRIQASVASGSAILCYIKGVKPADPEDPDTALNGDGLEFDNGHNYRRWPFSVAPTYFNSDTEKYLYIAIPRSTSVGTQAKVAFPSQKIDIYGYTIKEQPVVDGEGKMHDADGNETDDPAVAVKEQVQDEQIGTDDYFYIWLQGIISPVIIDGSTQKRVWTQPVETGTLASDEAIAVRDEDWYRWDPISQTVTFLKEIWMDAASMFRNLRAKVLILNGHTLNGVAVRDVTPDDSDDTIVTPAYLDGFSADKFLRKDRDDSTPFSLGVGGNLVVGGDERVRGSLNVDGDGTFGGLLQAMRGFFEQIQSPNFSGHSGTGSGWGITNNYDGNGKSRLTIDEIMVRGRMIIEELLVKRKEVTAGDQVFSCAANKIAFVRYIDGNGNVMGYEDVMVPWLLNVSRLLSADLTALGKIFSLTRRVYVGVRAEDMDKVRTIRCYFLASDGDRTVENLWKVGDLALCKTYNLTTSIRDTGTHTGQVYWWRRVIAVNRQQETIDNRQYHWFDVAYNHTTNHLLTNDWDAGSMIPSGGDDAVQLGHFPTGSDFDPTSTDGLSTGVADRMNAAMIEVNGAGNEDAPCYKLLFGIYTFSLSKCWYGGPVVRMSLSPKTGYVFYGPSFQFITADNKTVHTVHDREEVEWLKIAFTDDAFNTQPTYSDDIIDESAQPPVHTRSDGSSLKKVRKVWWFERVSHKGSLWVCVKQSQTRWFNRLTGDVMPVGWVPTANTDISNYETILTYCTSEPSLNNSDWELQVQKGTSIVSDTTKYAASQSYVVVPEPAGQTPQLTWRSTYQEMMTLDRPSGGWWIYEWRKIIYSDNTMQPTETYKVTRYGIDGDGIYAINSYFLGRESGDSINAANDDFPMPPVYPGDDASEAEKAAYRTKKAAYDAAQEPKWHDTFDAMATANGGLGSMQGWFIWEKTVVQYDKPNGKDQKQPVVSYQCNRIGADAVIGQEEYYMLAASDNFATVFGDPAQASTYYYAKTGIRWYTEDTPLATDLPGAENYRLSDTSPNINTSMWQTTMPAYDNSTSEKAARKYLWNFEWHADGMGTQFATKPRCLGNHAKGITGLIELYAISSSQTPKSATIHIPQDLYDKNGYGTIPTTGFEDKQVWGDERYDRAPTEALPYQWNWTRTLYSDGTHEDHYHVSAVRGTNGEDGAGEESIFINSTTEITTWGNAQSAHPHPKNILKDKDGNDRTAEYIATTDDFVPYGWSDNPVGISPVDEFEYVSTRKLGTPDANGRKRWTAFSDPVLRSNWGKAGIDGDGVEYVFIRTKNDVAPIITYDDNKNRTDSRGKTFLDDDYLPVISNAAACNAETSNSGKDAYPNECTDDQKDVTSLWPFEWSLQRQKTAPSTVAGTYGQRVWKCYGGEKTGDAQAMTKWHNFAENAMRLDLSNEMDMVLTDSTGKILAARTVEAVVRLYDGASEIDLSAVSVGEGGFSVSGEPTLGGSGIATRSLAAVGKGRKFSYTFKKDKVMSDVYDITISYTYKNLPYSATFTVGASKGQAIFQLKPSASALAFTRNSSNTLVAPAALSLKVEVVDSNTQTEVSSFDSSGKFTYGGRTIYVRYSKSTMPTGISSGSPWTGDVSVTVSEVTASTPVKDVYIAMFTSDGKLLDRETIPVVKDGLNGVMGSFKSEAFIRTSTDISNVTPTGGSYTSPVPTSTDGGSTWSDGIPAGSKQLWSSVCTFKGDGTNSGWSKPKKVMDSAELDIEFSPNSTCPADPTGNDPTADNTSARNAQGWYDPQKNASTSGVDWTAMIWRAERKISNGVYVGGWTKSRIKGEGGTPGGNTATIYLYKRKSTAPVSTDSDYKPGRTLYYKFSTKKLYTNSSCTTEFTGNTNGWTAAIPSGSDPLYVTAAIAYSATDTDDIGTNEWVAPAKFAENGGHGVNTATVFIYKRYASEPNDKPTGALRYTFATGAAVLQSGSMNNWVLVMPAADGNPCWVRQAAALGTGDTDDIETADWSSVRKLVEDGQSSFKSTMFVRMNATPTKPANNKGSYSNPSPSGCVAGNNSAGTSVSWSDGIPEGDNALWATTRIFSSDGNAPQQSAWTTPQKMTDTADFDVEFSSVASPNPPSGHPNTNTQWSNTASSATIWMAISECHNGVWSDWQVSKIKGEKGDSSVIYTLLPSATQIKATLNESGVYVTTDQLKCGYTKSDGTTVTSVDDQISRIDSKYHIFFRRRDRANQTWEDYYIVYTGNTSIYGVNARNLLLNLNVNTYDAVEFYMATNTTSTSKTVDGKVVYVITTTPNYIDKKDVSVIYDGKDGNATLYSLSCAPDVVNFRTNAVGDFNPDDETTVVCSVVKTTGDSSAVISSYSGCYLTYRCYYANGAVGDWNTSSAVSSGTKSFTVICEDAINTSAEDQLVGVEFALSTYGTAAGFDSHIIARKYIAVIIDGRRGATGQGAPGKMFYSMGEWSATTQYSISGLLIPMVHYNDGEFSEATGKGNYYYLKDGKTAYGNTQKPTNTTYWTKATGFGVVITQGLFAEFAKLGKAIMSGDYMFSMNGRIGSTEYNNGAKYNGVPAYTYFKGDPSKQTGTFFNPNWWVDLLTGKMIAARGNFVVNPNGDVTVAGTIKANNLFKDLSMSTGGRQTVIINANGDCDAWIYVNTRSTDHGYTFEAGTYILASEYDVLVDDVGSWKTDENFTICTGGADEVWLTDGDITGGFGGINNDKNQVFLPQCSKYAGKKVTIYHTLTVTNHNAEIWQCDGASKFSAGLTLTDFDISTSSNMSNKKSVQAGETAIFYSTGNCWVMLAHWT